MNELELIIETSLRKNATDIHIREGRYTRIRIDNALYELQEYGIPDLKLIVDQILDLVSLDDKADILEKLNNREDIDCAFTNLSGARMRANIFMELSGMGVALRVIPSSRLTANEIGLPFSVTDVCNIKSGLFLVTGANGSGKTTTIASLIDIMNATRNAHIITIEDPIEHVYRSRKSLITQREVGTHSKSFYSALRSCLRENPDVIMLGEMRDIETTRTALELAETGHLVIASLHTRTAISAIDRIIGQFPGTEQQQVRMMVSENLIGVLSQSLLVRKNGGLVAAFEILRSNSAIKNLIREQKIPQIYSVMQTSGRSLGMCTMEDSLLALAEAGVVSPQEALSKTLYRADLADKMRASVRITDTID